MKKILSIFLAALCLSISFGNVKNVHASEISQENSIIPMALDVTYYKNKIATKILDVGSAKITVYIRYSYYKDLNGYKWIDEISNISSTLYSSTHTNSGVSYSLKEYTQTNNDTKNYGTSTLGKINITGEYKYKIPANQLFKPTTFDKYVSFTPGE